MSYLAVDLDAKTAMPKVARAAGLSVGDVAWGLMELWEHAWREKTDVATGPVLAGCFGGGAATTDALVAFGFLEPTQDGYRIRGASRYLRIQEARSKGGKASSGNLKRGAKKARQPGVTPGSLPAAAGDQPGSVPGSAPALPASSEQRAAKEDVRVAPLVLTAPTPKPKPQRAPSKQEAWWQGAQAHAQERNPARVPEKHRPEEINSLLGDPLDEVGVHGLAAAWQRYLGDEHWKSKGWPLHGFVAQWRQFHNAIGSAPPQPPSLKVFR